MSPSFGEAALGQMAVRELEATATTMHVSILKSQCKLASLLAVLEKIVIGI